MDLLKIQSLAKDFSLMNGRLEKRNLTLKV